MAGESQLLRMLEPAVRPAGAPAPHRPPQAPIERQSFEQLLRDAAAATPSSPTESAVPSSASSAVESARRLDSASDPLRMSRHARQRLDQMGMTLDDGQMAALAEATDRAAERGARDTLMLMEQLGLIVNIPNRTVITAMSQSRMSSGVVTNIDSTVIVDAAPKPADRNGP